MVQNKILTVLGEISYSIYLVHVLIVTALVFWLIQFEIFSTLAPEIRFFIALVVTAPTEIGVSYVLYRYLEKPSIRLGAILISRLN